MSVARPIKTDGKLRFELMFIVNLVDIRRVRLAHDRKIWDCYQEWRLLLHEEVRLVRYEVFCELQQIGALGTDAV